MEHFFRISRVTDRNWFLDLQLFRPLDFQIFSFSNLYILEVYISRPSYFQMLVQMLVLSININVPRAIYKIWFGKLAEEQHWQVGLEKMGSPFFIFCSSAQNDSYLGFIGGALAQLLLQFTCKTSCFSAKSLKSSMILQNGFKWFTCFVAKLNLSQIPPLHKGW